MQTQDTDASVYARTVDKWYEVAELVAVFGAELKRRFLEEMPAADAIDRLQEYYDEPHKWTVERNAWLDR